jgi:hypothetical protein
MGTAARRAGSAVRTTIRLIALFMITAWRVRNPNTPISSGSRNSAPPRPMSPPRTSTPALAANAAGSDLGRSAR